ncbi:MAG: response regulator, partial [Desulfobulbaceae bacterium]|nr:response regulator [Desulfobulbaceae bacterium]
GSKFHFALPFEVADEEVSLPVKTLPESWRSLSVLVVDDHVATRTCLAEMLGGFLGNVQTAASGKEALERFRATPFDVVLLDVGLPEMDGMRLTQEISADPSLQNMAVILLVPVGLEMGDAVCSQGGDAYVCLPKPVTRSDMLNALRIVTGTSDLSPVNKLSDNALQHICPENMSILLVDDEKINRAVAEAIIISQGWRVTTVENGREALAALDEDQFDVVLMDIQMPEMDGLEATALIREKEKGAATHQPIIAMTAHAMKGDRERCLDGGMDGYVAKPVNVERLREEIARVLADTVDMDK